MQDVEDAIPTSSTKEMLRASNLHHLTSVIVMNSKEEVMR